MGSFKQHNNCNKPLQYSIPARVSFKAIVAGSKNGVQTFRRKLTTTTTTTTTTITTNNKQQQTYMMNDIHIREGELFCVVCWRKIESIWLLPTDSGDGILTHLERIMKQKKERE